MSLLGTPDPKNKMTVNKDISVTERFELACSMFRDGAFADAYAIFKDIADSGENVPVLVNLALCHMKVSEHERALFFLDKALQLSKGFPKEGKRADETYCKLFVFQSASESYLTPMPSNVIVSSKYPEETILRLIVDVCTELGQKERVRLIASSLSEKNYANIKRAMEKL